MSPTQALVEAGKDYPICQSEWDGFLHVLAYEHARYMASKELQGHQLFERRYNLVKEELSLKATEICAESWKWQEFATYPELGQEMFKCWKQSPGHWAVVDKVHKKYGAGMVMGDNGIWYACILVGD